MDRTLWENPRNTPAPQGATELPLSKEGKDVSSPFGTAEFGGSNFWLSVQIQFSL